MELPPKPELERRERIGQYGEIVSELTPDSEQRLAEYLRKLHFARIAIRSANEETTKTSDAEGATS